MCNYGIIKLVQYEWNPSVILPVSSIYAFSTTTSLCCHSWIYTSFSSCMLGWKCVYNSFVRKEQTEKTQDWPDFSVDAPENRDSPANNIHAVSCRDETSPVGYFAFLFAVKDLSVLRAFSVIIPDKEIYLSLAVLSIKSVKEKQTKKQAKAYKQQQQKWN